MSDLMELNLKFTDEDGKLRNLLAVRKEHLEHLPDSARAAWDEAEAAENKRLATLKIRQVIAKKVGDQQTILGTTADGAQLSVVLLMVLTKAFSEADSFKALKSGFIEGISNIVGPDVDPGELASGFLSQLASGDIKLTASVKGLEATLTEIFTRSTGVANILTSSDPKT